jgi:ABC-type dipeptide/oligopeptide/nickel transport system permease subunit
MGPGFWIGAALIGAFVLVALFGPVVAPFSPVTVGAGPVLQPPNAVHPFGTDALGRDLFSRVLHGGRIAMAMAMFGVTVSASIGVALGAAAGYYGGRPDQMLSRLMEIWLAFPGVLLAVIIVARLGPGLTNATLALGIVGVPVFFRLMRNTTLSARRTCYVEAAHSVGASDRRIMLRHILPNVGSPVIVLVTMRLGILILSGSALSFIGLGAQPPQPEWGALLAAGRDYMDVAPWLAVLPGLCITLTVVGLNLLGDGLRDALDPQQSRRP